jgi:subtilisin family serine protease
MLIPDEVFIRSSAFKIMIHTTLFLLERSPMRVQWNIASLCISAMVIGVLVVPSPALALEGESTYVVQVAPGNQQAVAAQIEDIGGVVTSVLDEALDGLVVSLTPTEATLVARETTNTSISAAQPLQLMTTQDTTGTTGTGTGVGKYNMWNLSRLDQTSLPVDTSYTYPASAGSGVFVYVVDTGINALPDFAGHFAPGRNFATSDQSENDAADCTAGAGATGHGTHVAGIVGSRTFGVAKNVTLVPVRIFDCAGASNTATAIEALNWIVKDLATKPAGTRAVVNMSFGTAAGTRNLTLETVVANLTADDIVVVVAAGNDNADACNTSPGAAPSALTVGATNASDARSSFSNFGKCLDVFAPGGETSPGEGIWSLKWDNSSQVLSYPGTSQAAPHVAGIAALALAANPSLSVAEISSQIINNAVADKISNPGTSSPNRLANMSWLNSPATAPTPTTTPESTPGTNANLVRNLYHDFLSRTASADEVNYWAGELNTGRATQASLTTILSTSDEWIRVVIRGFYVDTLGREPDSAGYQYWIDRARGGEPIADIGAFFYGSDEYFNGFGQSNNRAWVSDLYTKLMLRSADSGGLNYWLGQLSSGMSRTAVSRWFYQSPEKLGLRVDALYSKLLNRGSDPDGRAYWSGVLASAGDLRLASFLASSPEYFNRRFTG